MTTPQMITVTVPLIECPACKAKITARLTYETEVKLVDNGIKLGEQKAVGLQTSHDCVPTATRLAQALPAVFGAIDEEKLARQLVRPSSGASRAHRAGCTQDGEHIGYPCQVKSDHAPNCTAGAHEGPCPVELDEVF